jgi:hypothetical protein
VGLSGRQVHVRPPEAEQFTGTHPSAGEKGGEISDLGITFCGRFEEPSNIVF